MKPILKNVVLILCVNQWLVAGGMENGGYAGAYQRIGVGARSLAMGNTGVATAADGFCVYYNAARLPFLESRRLATSYAFMTLDRQYHYVGLALPLQPAAGMSVAWLHAGVRDIQGRTSTGMPDDVYQTGEDALIMSFANRFHPRLAAGVSLKILRHSLPELSGKGIGFDVGLLFRLFDFLTIGLQLKDISASYTWNTQELFSETGGNYTERFPQLLKMGFAFTHPGQMVITGDLEISDKRDYRAYFGGEYSFSDQFFVRLGLNHLSPTIGGGLSYGLFGKTNTRIDYCALFGHAGEGLTHIFGWEFGF